jgi:hypothetical protein
MGGGIPGAWRSRRTPGAWRSMTEQANPWRLEEQANPWRLEEQANLRVSRFYFEYPPWRHFRSTQDSRLPPHTGPHLPAPRGTLTALGPCLPCCLVPPAPPALRQQAARCTASEGLAKCTYQALRRDALKERLSEGEVVRRRGCPKERMSEGEVVRRRGCPKERLPGWLRRRSLALAGENRVAEN